MRTKNEILNDCPVAVTVSLIGSKWKLLILRNLLSRPWRFNELKNSIDGISPKMLTESLRTMERDGLVLRTEVSDSAQHIEYSLTELGETLRPVIKSMESWGTYYQDTHSHG